MSQLVEEEAGGGEGDGIGGEGGGGVWFDI